MSDNFCTLPFTEIFLYPNGDIKPCCSAMLSLGNLHKNNITEILNSDIAKDVRQHVLDGKWHPLCKQCQRQEQQGVRSERHPDKQGLEKEITNINNSSFLLKRLDLRWSNTCNLSCVYCYEGFSSKWASIKGLRINDVDEENENSLFQLIEENKDSINSVMMLGGEPLLQKQNSKLVDLLQDKQFHVVTNLSVPVKTNAIAQKLIKLGKRSNFSVSFETVGDRFEYVRRGASWDQFTENVQYFNSIKRPLEAYSLYSIYSAFNLLEFYDFITKNKFKNVFWNLLESSGESSKASVFYLPTKLKEMAIKEINKCTKRYKGAPGIEQLGTFKNNLITMLDNNSTTEYHKKEILSVETLQNYKHTFADLWPNIHKELI